MDSYLNRHIESPIRRTKKEEDIKTKEMRVKIYTKKRKTITLLFICVNQINYKIMEFKLVIEDELQIYSNKLNA